MAGVFIYTFLQTDDVVLKVATFIGVLFSMNVFVKGIRYINNIDE